MSWKTNPVMEWLDGATWVKISDHGRSPLSISVERIENKQRMVNGTMRRYVVGKKRVYSCSWDNLPDKDGVSFLANGDHAGQWMEDFHDRTDGAFKMRLRSGDDRGKATTHTDIEEVQVMITDFSKEVTRRGQAFDLWNITLTLEEV